jgi:hypothetical protein
VMLPIPSLEDLQAMTTAMLLSGHGNAHYAAETSGCVWDSQCGQRYCPRCVRTTARARRDASELALLVAAEAKALAGEPFCFITYTVRGTEVFVSDLRKAADRMTKDHSKMVSNRPRVILGSTAVFEAPPSKSGGAVMQEKVHAHLHCCLAITDPHAQALLAFREEPQVYWGFNEKSLEEAIGWINYMNKVSDTDSADYWQGELQQPEIFVRRAEQMKNFQLCRSTGKLRPPASPRAVTQRLRRLDRLTRREKMKHK